MSYCCIYRHAIEIFKNKLSSICTSDININRRSYWQKGTWQQISWYIAYRHTVPALENNSGSQSVAPSSHKEAAIVMLNISSIDWGKSSESLKRERHHNKYLLNLCTPSVSGYSVVFQHQRQGCFTANHLWRNGHRCYGSELQSKARRLAVLQVCNPGSTTLAVTGMGWKKKSLWLSGSTAHCMKCLPA